MHTRVKYRSQIIRALTLSSFIFLLAACSQKKALVLIDPVLDTLDRATSTALCAFKPAGWSVRVVKLPIKETEALIASSILKTKPSLILASPLLIADLLAGLRPGIRLATIGIGEEDSRDDPRLMVARFDSSAAYRALGRLMAMIIMDYDRDHPDKSRCGVLFSEGNGRPRRWLDAFIEGYASAASLSTLSTHQIASDPASSFIFPGEEEMNAVAALESLNLSALLVIPGSRFLQYSGLFPAAIVISDEGEPGGMIDLSMIPAAPGSSSPRLDAMLDRNPESALLLLRQALSSGFSGNLPVSLDLALTKAGKDRTLEGKNLRDMFRESLSFDKASQDTGFSGN